MTIALDLYRDLPKVRAAFDARELQAQVSPGDVICLYDGPCAIGSMLAPDQRTTVDNYEGATTIGGLLTAKIITAPEEQRFDLNSLQAVHDYWMQGSWPPDLEVREAAFAEKLEQLEAKYGSAEVKS